jgi:hypothetical protein
MYKILILKSKYLVLTLIFLLIFSSAVVHGLKIQIDDHWKYIDENKNKFDEKVTDLYIASGANIAIVSVETDRPFPYPYYNVTLTGLTEDVHDSNIIYNYNYTSNFVFQKGTLELTQLGGLPIAHKRNFTASISVVVWNDTYQKDFSYIIIPEKIVVGNVPTITNKTLTWLFGNDNPEIALTTRTPVSYAIAQHYDYIGGGFIPQNENDFTLELSCHYLLSSLGNNPNNFTQQYTFIDVIFSTPELFIRNVIKDYNSIQNTKGS